MPSLLPDLTDSLTDFPRRFLRAATMTLQTSLCITRITLEVNGSEAMVVLKLMLASW